MLIKYWTLKNYRMVKIFHSNTLLGIMTMILLDYYF